MLRGRALGGREVVGAEEGRRRRLPVVRVRARRERARGRRGRVGDVHRRRRRHARVRLAAAGRLERRRRLPRGSPAVGRGRLRWAVLALQFLLEAMLPLRGLRGVDLLCVKLHRDGVVVLRLRLGVRERVGLLVLLELLLLELLLIARAGHAVGDRKRALAGGRS